MRNRLIVITAIVIAVGAWVGGLWSPTTPSIIAPSLVPLASPRSPVAAPTDLDARLKEVREAFAEIEKTAAQTEERVRQGEATLRRQQRLLDEVQRVEDDFEAGRMTPHEYLLERERLNQKIDDGAV